MVVKIIYVKSDVMAVLFGQTLYYLDCTEWLPRVFDSDLKQLVISNIDSWIQAKTAQKYSLATLREMGNAFADGMRASYTKTEVLSIVEYASRCVTSEILRRGAIYDYSLLYWIEVQGTEVLEKYLKTISEKLNTIVERLGVERIVNELKRIQRVCLLRQSSAKYMCDKLLERLGANSVEPQYPSTREIDMKVLSHVRNEVLKYLRQEHKAVDASIVEVVDGIQARGLQRTESDRSSP